MNFKKWVKSIQTTGYNGARTVVATETIKGGKLFKGGNYMRKYGIPYGLYTFCPLFEVHLCTVTFGLMYG